MTASDCNMLQQFQLAGDDASSKVFDHCPQVLNAEF